MGKTVACQGCVVCFNVQLEIPISIPAWRRGGDSFKSVFPLPAYFQGQMLALFLGRIEVADKAYINGRLIGGTGNFPPHMLTPEHIHIYQVFLVQEKQVCWSTSNQAGCMPSRKLASDQAGCMPSRKLASDQAGCVKC